MTEHTSGEVERDGGKITLAELRDMFGRRMPIDALKILQSDAPLREVRAQLAALRDHQPKAPTGNEALREAVRQLDGWLGAEQIDESTSPQNGEDFASWSSGYLTAIDLCRQQLAALTPHNGETE